MKYLISINISILLFITSNLYAVDKSEIETIISTVKTEVSNIENNFEMRKHIPFDVYNELVLHLISASIHLKDRNYEKSFFYAKMCSIKLDTMKTLIEASQYRDKTERLKMESSTSTSEDSPCKEQDCSLADIPLNSITKANLNRKGTTFKVDLLDNNIFRPHTFTLSEDGKKQLDSIAEAILDFPDSKVKIIGHTRWEDYRKHSKWKAKVVYNFLMKKGIDSNKTTFLGVGNRIVMKTPWGLRRVSRVEVIIYDIKLKSRAPIKKVDKKPVKKIKLKKIKKEEEMSDYEKLMKDGFLKKVE